MEPLEALERARREFPRRLALVTDGDWGRPTPCEGWDVRDLVEHVIGSNRLYVPLVQGAGFEEAMATLEGDVVTDDPLAAYERSSDAVMAAFSEPGALDRTCHHIMGDMPGSMLLALRFTDLAVHAWDLARAIGADETLDAELVEHIHAGVEPISGTLAATGLFAAPSGDVPGDAPLQHRLLDLMGRRP